MWASRRQWMGRSGFSIHDLVPSPLEGEGARRADEGLPPHPRRLGLSLIRLGLRPIHLLPQGEKGRRPQASCALERRFGLTLITYESGQIRTPQNASALNSSLPKMLIVKSIE